MTEQAHFEYKSPNWFPSPMNDIDFQTLWEMSLNPLDVKNTKKGGWSRVFLWQVNGKKLIVKRQSGFTSRTLLSPFKGVPTFLRELHNIHRLCRLHIPTPSPVYYGQRFKNSQWQAILVTEFLEGYVSLQNILVQWSGSLPSPGEKRPVIAATASLIRQFHEQKLRHQHLVPKHIFLKSNFSKNLACIIDLEATRRFLPFKRNAEADLVSFNRRSRWASRTDKIRFLFAYLGISRWNPKAKRFARTILKNTERKVRRP